MDNLWIMISDRFLNTSSPSQVDINLLFPLLAGFQVGWQKAVGSGWKGGSVWMFFAGEFCFGWLMWVGKLFWFTV